MTRTCRLTLALCTAVLMAACGSNSSNPAAPSNPAAKVTTITVTSAQTSATSIHLTATAQLSDGTSKDVTSVATWVSSNPALATVSTTGVVTVVGSGELDVRASYQSVTGSLHLLVTRVPVTSVTISGSPSTTATTFQLTATANLSDGSTQNVTSSATWTSSNTQVATVSQSGVVTVVSSGDVDVQAAYQGTTGTSHFTVALPKTYSFTGVVAEAAPNAHPVAGARVQIVVGNYATTDSNGVFSIAGVPVGRSIVEVTKDGYQTWDGEINVVNQDVQQQITIYPTPPKDASGASATARCNDGSWSWAQTKADACTANGGVAYAVCPGALCSQ